MAERWVTWDQHNDLPRDITLQCKGVDQPSAALIQDLKQRGMEETLVIWGGEFGRTVYCQGKLTATNCGRDHHPKCFAMWMASNRIYFQLVEDRICIENLQVRLMTPG